MSGRRKDLKVNQLVDQYLRKSKDLDAHLNELQSELEAHQTRIDRRHQLEDRLDELNSYIEDAECSIDGLRERYHDATFREDEHAITTIQHQRCSLLSAIQDYKKAIADTNAELDSVAVDSIGVAQLAATLQAGVKIPQHGDVVKVIQDELAKLASAQQSKLTELRSSVPSQFKDQQAYDLAMKALDSSYRTSDEVKQAAAARQQAIADERRRFNQHQPTPSEEIRRQKDRQLALANSTPVKEAQQW